MTLRKKSRKIRRSLCGEVHPEDGIDPRDWAKGKHRRTTPHKTRQLCSQVAETLGDTLAAQGDDLLRSLHVVSVVPAPDVSRLLVTVAPFPGEEGGLDPVRAIEHLEHASARLRFAVAAAITRKRAPLLVYRSAVPAVPRDDQAE